MSNYTTEVRYICEYYANCEESEGFDKIDEIIENSHDKVLGNYPIFDENYRLVLDKKILKHYYTREICEETVGLWKLRINNRLNEIMPYYNKLYNSELLKFNPFYDVDISTTRLRNEDSSGNLKSKMNDNRSEIKSNEMRNEQSGQSISENNKDSSEEKSSHTDIMENNVNKTNGKDKDLYSDTPQGAITNLENETYLTNARIVNKQDNDNNVSQQASDVYGGGSNNENSQNSVISNATNNSGFDESTNVNTNSEKNDENTINTTEDYLEQVQGKRGGTSFTKMLMEYRESFLNIDRMIIDELNDLFFGLWA